MLDARGFPTTQVARAKTAQGKPLPPERVVQDAQFQRRLKLAESILERQKLRERSQEESQKKESSSNFKRIEPLRPTLEKVGGDIPLSLKLGWIDKESSGQVDLDETVRQRALGNAKYKQDEVGLFQISKDERAEILHLKPADRERILKNSGFAVEQGVRLIHHYENQLKRGFNFSEESPALWQVTKLAHKLGWPTVRRMLSQMERDYAQGVTHPSKATWDEIKTNILLHAPEKVREKTSDALMRVDFVLLRGRFLEQQGR